MSTHDLEATLAQAFSTSAAEPPAQETTGPVTEEKVAVAEPLVTSVSAQKFTFLLDAVIYHFPNGVDKTVSIHDFVDSINEAYAPIKQEAIRSFILPQALRKFSPGVSSMKMTMYYPSCIQKIQHVARDSSPVTYEVILPNIVITVTLEKGSKANSWTINRDNVRYLCTSSSYNRFTPEHYERAEPSKGVYIMPFPNMYENGRICFGNETHMPRDIINNNFSPIDQYFQFLFQTPFNDDLGVRGVSGYSPTDWWKYLQERAKNNQPFPYEKLRDFS